MKNLIVFLTIKYLFIYDKDYSDKYIDQIEFVKAELIVYSTIKNIFIDY